MREPDFWACELREVFNRIRGFNQLEEQRYMQDMVVTRWQTAAILNMARAKKSKAIKPSDLVKLPIDELIKESRPVMSAEERARRKEKADRVFAKIMQLNGKG